MGIIAYFACFSVIYVAASILVPMAVFGIICGICAVGGFGGNQASGGTSGSCGFGQATMGRATNRDRYNGR